MVLVKFINILEKKNQVMVIAVERDKEVTEDGVQLQIQIQGAQTNDKGLWWCKPGDDDGRHGNGCYLTAPLYLCPAVTTGNLGNEKDWLKFEYVGVPPGRNARGVIATKIAGVVMYTYTEGWPEQRTGRHIAYQRMSSHSNYPARELYFDNIVIAACWWSYKIFTWKKKKAKKHNIQLKLIVTPINAEENKSV